MLGASALVRMHAQGKMCDLKCRCLTEVGQAAATLRGDFDLIILAYPCSRFNPRVWKTDHLLRIKFCNAMATVNAFRK